MQGLEDNTAPLHAIAITTQETSQRPSVQHAKGPHHQIQIRCSIKNWKRIIVMGKSLATPTKSPNTG